MRKEAHRHFQTDLKFLANLIQHTHFLKNTNKLCLEEMMIFINLDDEIFKRISN